MPLIPKPPINTAPFQDKLVWVVSVTESGSADFTDAVWLLSTIVMQETHQGWRNRAGILFGAVKARYDAESKVAARLGLGDSNVPWRKLRAIQKRIEDGQDPFDACVDQIKQDFESRDQEKRLTVVPDESADVIPFPDGRQR